MVRRNLIDLLPYSLQQQSDGRFVLLDRGYNPLGVDCGMISSYETSSFRLYRLSDKTIDALTNAKAQDPHMIWLYNDASKPVSSQSNMEDYLNKLKLLMKLKIRSD